MRKSFTSHIVIMIISVGIGTYLASKLLTEQQNIAKSRNYMSTTPMGGFNKFASDVQWMFFIYHCGKLEQINKDNIDGIFKKLDQILGNDPDFEKAYNMGGLMLSVRAPLKSVTVLMRGARNPNLQNNWKLPFLAGYVLVHNIKDAQWKTFATVKNENNKNVKGYIKLGSRLAEAEKMFRLAVERSDSRESYIVSALMRVKAQRLFAKKTYNKIPLVNKKHAYLCALFDEWNKGNMNNPEESVALEFENGGACRNMENRILKAVQAAKSSAPGNKNIIKTVDTIIAKVLLNRHLCQQCLQEYLPGEKFCSSCGHKVKLYGVCVECGAIKKGKYCTKCGHMNIK